jgi:hypothetical protein
VSFNSIRSVLSYESNHFEIQSHRKEQLMHDEEAIEKLGRCHSLCQRLARLEEGGVELSEADHLAFAAFREVYYAVMESDPREGPSSKHKELESQERLEGLALAAGLTRPELVMLVSLLALNNPRATSSSSKASFPASRSKRRRGSKFRAKE